MVSRKRIPFANPLKIMESNAPFLYDSIFIKRQIENSCYCKNLFDPEAEAE